MKIFILCARIHRYCEAKIAYKYGLVSYKKRAIYALISGFARAGIYWCS